MSKKHGARSRWASLVPSVAAAFLVGAVLAWSLSVVMTPSKDPSQATDHTFVETTEGEVGASLNLRASAEWKSMPVGSNKAIGVVTNVAISPGDIVDQGTVLYSVNLRPVTIAEGSIPAFRTISDGMSGDDVTQIQHLLRALGHYDGGVDGKVEGSTISAIKRWQKSLNIEQTGVIDTGDIIFVPKLPARVTLNSDLIGVDTVLNGGERVLERVSDHPSFTIPVTDAQANLVVAGSRVEVTSPSGEAWLGATGATNRSQDGSQISIEVVGPGDGSLCADNCDDIPLLAASTLNAVIYTSEIVDGIVVPSSALFTEPDGTTVVFDSESNRIAVEVKASAAGMSVIEGIDKGVRVKVPAKPNVDNQTSP